MTEPKAMYRCETCGQNFQLGPHVYEGKYIPAYQITVCNGCYNANWDGWAPHFEEAVTRKLVEKGSPMPARNAKGWLPRDG